MDSKMCLQASWFSSLSAWLWAWRNCECTVQNALTIHVLPSYLPNLPLYLYGERIVFSLWEPKMASPRTCPITVEHTCTYCSLTARLQYPHLRVLHPVGLLRRMVEEESFPCILLFSKATTDPIALFQMPWERFYSLLLLTTHPMKGLGTVCLSSHHGSGVVKKQWGFPRSGQYAGLSTRKHVQESARSPAAQCYSGYQLSYYLIVRHDSRKPLHKIL